MTTIHTDLAPQPHHRGVAIVEDHLLQRKRTEELVDVQPGLQTLWSGETLTEFLAWQAQTKASEQPEILLLDLMVEQGPSASLEQINAVIRSGMKVLVISAMASPRLLQQAIRAGVAGFVGKRDSEADIVAAIWTVLGGGSWMTPTLASMIADDASRPSLSDQEERVLMLYASGLTLKGVAELMGIQSDTAKKYLSRIKLKYAEMGRPVNTKLELNRIAREDGFLES